MGNRLEGLGRWPMEAKAGRWAVVALVSTALMALTVPLHAQVASSLETSGAPAAESSSKGDAGLSVTTWTVDGGGGTASGGTFTASVTIGQPEAESVLVATGGSYSLAGGFWGMAAPARGPFIFSSGFEAQMPAVAD